MRFRNYVLSNFPFLEDDFDALTDYQLFSKMLAYVRKMSKQFDDFQIKLDKYENYFNNLNVQEEIDNKLEEMYENGQLENIISEFLALQSTYTFDDVAKLKLAQNLVDGCYTKTLGYNSQFDGGSAYYYIREKDESDTIDDIFTLSLYDSNLVADLIVKDNTINVKQAGLTGLDTDDATSILTTVFAKGYNMYFPNGTYVVSDDLTLISHKLIGEDKKDTIIKVDAENNIELINSNNIKNLEIANITFDLGSLTDATQSAINLYNTDNLHIYNCNFKDGYGSQLRLNGSKNVLIENCYFTGVDGLSGNPGECIYCNGIDNITVTRCSCDDIGDHFLYLDGSNGVSNAFINNCNLSETGGNNLTNGASISIYGDCENVFISNNIINNCKTGINVDIRNLIKPKYIYIKDNTITNSTQNGIYGKGDYVNITNNIINNSSQDGIQFDDSTYLNIINNLVYENTRSGINIDNSSYINLLNDICYDNTSVGIVVGNNYNCNHVNVTNCECYATSTNSELTGFQFLKGSDVKLTSCTSYNHVVDWDTNNANVSDFVSLLNPFRGTSDTRSITFSNAIPNVGLNNRGDIVFYTSPSANGYIGAVCVTAGAPGTWKEFGKIEN